MGYATWIICGIVFYIIIRDQFSRDKAFRKIDELQTINTDLQRQLDDLKCELAEMKQKE